VNAAGGQPDHRRGTPLLIALAQGLSVGGVMTWAVRLANGLAARGRGAMLLLHPEPPGQIPVEVEFHPGVMVSRPAGLPHFGERTGDLSPYIPHYLGAVRRLAAEFGGPVAVAPTMHGDCFGAAAAVCQAEPDLVRVIGWQQSDIEYDARVLARYEPMISRFVGVSDRIEATLRSRLGGRGADIRNIPYGVEIGAEPTGRDRARGAPLRLIYTGRLEHQQKRVLALIHMSDELKRLGVAHELRVVGDGPAAAEFDALAASRPSIRRTAPVVPREVARLLAESDAFVLPSRYEGLSVSMLEAMAAGCVPVLARTESGAMQAIEPGYNGEIAATSPEADERSAGLAMAAAVARCASRDLPAMSRAAWRTAQERFSIEGHVEMVAALLDEAGRGPARAWPADRSCAFTAAAGVVSADGSGSVPADGAARLAALLASLAGRRVVIHGTGQHTIQLGPVLAQSPATIVGFCDDDRQRCGQMLWGWPIVPPVEAAGTGATDVVIGSWMHQEALWARRGVYESQGLRVHRIYG